MSVDARLTHTPSGNGPGVKGNGRFARWAFAVAVCAVPLSELGIAGPDSPGVPAGTRVRFHLDETISSDHSHTGDTFHFTLLAPLSANGATIALEGATGSGTVFLAGASGSLGHEGDLTLRIESLPTVDGRYVTFDDQRFQINGRNRKLASAVLGFVPYAGFGARFIRGSGVTVDPARPVDTVLLREATIAATVLPQAVPVPIPRDAKAPPPSPSPSPEESSAPSATPSPSATSSESAAPAASPTESSTTNGA